MAEILVKAQDNPSTDPHAFKRGLPVVVMPDGHQWGNEEGLPKFVVIKIPGVDVARVEKYIDQLFEIPQGETKPILKHRRLWRMRFDDMPLSARNKLRDNGELTIKVGTYSGTFDYTWTQVKNYFLNLETNQNETEEI